MLVVVVEVVIFVMVIVMLAEIVVTPGIKMSAPVVEVMAVVRAEQFSMALIFHVFLFVKEKKQVMGRVERAWSYVDTVAKSLC